MYSTDYILKVVAEAVYAEEGLFFVTLNVDGLNLPLDGIQRLVLGGKATPDLDITDDGIGASLSIKHVHYNIHILWGVISAIEGNSKAFYCERENDEGDEGKKENENKDQNLRNHLKVVK